MQIASELKDEYCSINNQKVFYLLSLLSIRKAVFVKRMHEIKMSRANQIENFKVHLVGKGRVQTEKRILMKILHLSQNIVHWDWFYCWLHIAAGHGIRWKPGQNCKALRSTTIFIWRSQTFLWCQKEKAILPKAHRFVWVEANIPVLKSTFP